MSGSKRTRWSREAMDALEQMYIAGRPLAEIAERCSAIDATVRTRHAVWDKARAIGLSGQGRGKGGHKRMSGYRRDLIDMMTLDYSERQMADALCVQYGRPFTQGWVNRELKRIGGSEWQAWRKRLPQRRSRAMERRMAIESARRVA